MYPVPANITISLLLAFCITSASVSCNNGRTKESVVVSGTGMTGTEYARGFEAEEHENHTVLRVFDPWQGARNLTFEYILAGHDAELPDSLHGTMIIRTPVRSVICLSTTHIAMIDFIGETGRIAAVSGGSYIYNKEIRSRVTGGDIPDIGYDMNLNYELILQINPDVIFAYGVGAETRTYVSRLQGLGIKVVMIGEYLESSPLAQAEWVRFISRFFNRENLASEKFSEIAEEYNRLSEAALTRDHRPVVMTGLPWRESWFVPGGNSLMATLIADAGGRYLWENRRGRENFPVDLETVFTAASGADIWINTGTATSLKEIENTDTRLTLLPPFRNNSVYNNNARLNESGGNDFWESGIVNPHLVLGDLIEIIHPGLQEFHQWSYYRKL